MLIIESKHYDKITTSYRKNKKKCLSGSYYYDDIYENICKKDMTVHKNRCKKDMTVHKYNNKRIHDVNNVQKNIDKSASSIDKSASSIDKSPPSMDKSAASIDKLAQSIDGYENETPRLENIQKNMQWNKRKKINKENLQGF